MLGQVDTVAIELDPAEDPISDEWNWWLTISVGEIEIEAMLSVDLDSAGFENSAGYFDDIVPLDQVADYLLSRISS